MNTEGAEIKRRRETRGWSQAALGREVGTSQQTVDKIEKGEVRFSRYLPRIRKTLGMDEPAESVLKNHATIPP
ncbi:MAG: helix-turn-helix transcriptional regulator [Alphaproteobacteria bacterium]|nr:helix-turn-helix transcriptional regulator [Alphaproteobacteria bacterium]